MEDDHNKTMESNGDEDNIGCNKEEDQKLIESAKGKMGEVREENETLKVLLAQLLKEYESLQMHFYDILRQDHHNHQQEDEEATKATTGTADHSPNIDDNTNEQNELVSLSLGLLSKGSIKDDENYKISNTSIKENEKNMGEGLALGLDVRFDPDSGEVEGTNIVSIEGSSDEEGKEEEATEIWPPSRVLKTMRSGDNTTEAPQQAQLKKARVSIRARCDAQTMNDGCQWRKYGQKIAKGNPYCPRAYYRCTVSPSCRVKKQVQRCAEDTSILITTYEGTHNHPLPISATPMASTTSVAASMFQSPSSFTVTSQSNHSPSSQHTAPIFNSSILPLNYSFNNALTNFSSSSMSRPLHQHFYFPNTSISTCNSHPTITLDLTSLPPSSSHHQFRKFTSSGFSVIPSYNSNSQSPSPSSSYYNGGSYFNNYGNGTLLPHMNRNQSSGKQPFVQQQALQEEPIAAATKAITTNPKFQTAIAAALTSYVGGTNTNNNGGVGSFYSPSCSNKNAIDCTGSSSRYMMNYNMSSSSGVNNAQQGSLILFPPLPAASRNASGSVSSDRSNQILEHWKGKNLTIAPKDSNL